MNRGMTAAILVIFAGYTIASYGYVLLKGWDIPFKAWIDPLDAYRWPGSGVPGPIPPGQVFPGQATLVPAFGASGAFGAIQNEGQNLTGGGSGGG